jgi:hypothetical protein
VAVTPTYVGRGGLANGTGPVAVPLRGDETTDDIMVIVAEASEATAITATPCSNETWAHVTGSPVVGASTTLHVLWARVPASFVPGSVTLSDPGDHTIARAFLFRGCATHEVPWSGTPGTGTQAAGTANITIVATTSTRPSTLVLLCATHAADLASSTVYSSPTNANLGTLTERTDDSVSDGNGGGFFVGTGTFAGPGSCGTTAVTRTGTANAAAAFMALALQPPFSDGALSATLGTLTGAAVGEVDTHGAAAVTLGAVTATAAGEVDTHGAAAITLDGLTVDLTGAVAIVGASPSNTLGALTCAAAGSVPNVVGHRGTAFASDGGTGTVSHRGVSDPTETTGSASHRGVGNPYDGVAGSASHRGRY